MKASQRARWFAVTTSKAEIHFVTVAPVVAHHPFAEGGATAKTAIGNYRNHLLYKKGNICENGVYWAVQGKIGKPPLSGYVVTGGFAP